MKQLVISVFVLLSLSNIIDQNKGSFTKPNIIYVLADELGYGDFVMMLDSYIGQLVTTIEEASIKNNTIVIFTSDNACAQGANFNVLEQKGHYSSYVYREHKTDIFEKGHKGAFIVNWSKEIEKGIISNEIICTTYLMTNYASIVGYSLSDNEGEDNYDLLTTFIQQNQSKPIREATIHHSINGSFAIWKGDWKLIMYPGSGGWSFSKSNYKKVIDASLDINYII